MDEEFLAEPRRQLTVVEALLQQLGLNFVPVADAPVGVGLALAWGETDFLVVSVGAGSSHTVCISGGVLRDVEQQKLALLEVCNDRNGSNPAYCFYLHDADVGWDVIVQLSHPLQAFVDAPQFLQACLEPTMGVIAEARPEFAQRGVGGQPYRWNDDDRQRLLLRSLI